MSMECGECERDLRGGHWIGCSRYNLVRGVAEAMEHAAGRDTHDEEYEPTKQALLLAEAAIAHVRAVDEARANP